MQKPERQGGCQQRADYSAVSAWAHSRQLGIDRGQSKAAKPLTV